MDPLIIIMLITIIIPLLVLVGIVEYHLYNYIVKGGRNHRRYILKVAGEDYVIWLPERKKQKGGVQDGTKRKKKIYIPFHTNNKRGANQKMGIGKRVIDT